MHAKHGLFVIVLVAFSSPAWAQWESGSDGSDGAFSPAASVVVDLSLAIPGDALTTPGSGNGVYDAARWVVCFKYTSITVPAGATITFGMHPSGAPVVWLAQGDVTINGRVDLDGEDNVQGPNIPIIPYFTRPGPGGFEGGQAGHSGAAGASFGFGPGTSQTNSDNIRGAGASHATTPDQSGCCGSTPLTGPIYGNETGMPLLGGSGGNVAPNNLNPSGGAGGGAILIAAPILITVGGSGSIAVQGGNGFGLAGAGSGGTIRLRAETITLANGSQIIGRGGIGGGDGGCGGTCEYGGHGRVRIEASVVNNLGTINGSQSFPGAPSPVFPAAQPRLWVESVCGQAAPADPEWGIKTADIDINSAVACSVQIRATGVPAGNIVTVRVIPARGNIITANSTILTGGGGGAPLTASANITFPAGRSEIQLRTNW